MGDGGYLATCDINLVVHLLGEQTCPCSQLHGSGPWLIVYGRGPQSEDTATYLRQRCVDHSVWCELKSIDEVNHEVPLVSFPGLVAVLPSQVTEPAADLDPFSHLIRNYRARRPDGFESNRNRGRAWFYAGVVHLVGRSEIMQNSLIVATQKFVCAQYCVDNSDPVDVFQLYTHPFPILKQWSNESNSNKETIQRLLSEVQAWGITMDDVPKIRKSIDDCRGSFENESKYPALFRPLQIFRRSGSSDKAWEINMLDIILDKKDADVKEQMDKYVEHMNDTRKAKFKKAYKENGARACRTVIKELGSILPGLARPSGKEGKKDLQKDFRRLHRNLQAIDSTMNRHGGNRSS